MPIGRKIIQISAVASGRENNETVYALCDDGTVWWLTFVDEEWVRLEPIPQEEVHAD